MDTSRPRSHGPTFHNAPTGVHLCVEGDEVVHDSNKHLLQSISDTERIMDDKQNRISKRRWFIPQLRVRDLLWIFVVTGVLAMWYQDREQLKKQLGIIPTTVDSWSVDQVLGAPDTTGPGDINTAWASKSQDKQNEWLIVEFPSVKTVASIHIHETHNPGAVFQIDSVDWQGNETSIWKGTDPTARNTGCGVSVIALTTPVKTRRIKIHIDSVAVPGWNEIDAVAIIGSDGSKQHASNSWASSSYGDNREKPEWFWP